MYLLVDFWFIFGLFFDSIPFFNQMSVFRQFFASFSPTDGFGLSTVVLIGKRWEAEIWQGASLTQYRTSKFYSA
jgi:hypothetical protein